MLEIVSKGFKNAKATLTGKTTLTEQNIIEAVREIRVSLLEADVELVAASGGWRLSLVAVAIFWGSARSAEMVSLVSSAWEVSRPLFGAPGRCQGSVAGLVVF